MLFYCCLLHYDTINDGVCSKPIIAQNTFCSISLLLHILVFCLVFLLDLIILSGDVELNPGPSSASDLSSISSLSDAMLDGFKSCLDTYTSFVHLNVQSLVPKLDIINTELKRIDVLCFSETWLNSDISNDDLLLDGFHPPYRNDRIGRRGGGVAIYVKNNLHTTIRNDLAMFGLESVWVEIRAKCNKHVLVGVFYRPPDSCANVYNLIEHSLDQAVDTGVENIVILGDFNENYLVDTNTRMKNIIARYDMVQYIDEPTHFTELSSSCLDLVIANNRNVIDLVHGGQSFLDANTRFHCPTYGIIKIEKPSQTCFKRRIWLYERGDFDSYRNILSNVDWESFIINANNDVDFLVNSLTDLILKTATETIPNKIITVRKLDPPWMNNEIRRAIRKRDRFHKRAKKSDFPEHWSKFRKIRNRTVNLVRKQKQLYLDGLVDKLRSNTLDIRNWWMTASKVAGFKSRDSDSPHCL